MTDLAEFLSARVAEDEEFAWEAVQRPWFAEDNFVDGVSGGSIARFEIKADARHVARWDPARVLAECAAKRAIVEMHVRGIRETVDPGLVPDLDCAECDQPFPCPTLRLLAQPYADHPDFDSAWGVE